MCSREKFIDVARGLAIIFIVLGHTIVHSSNSFLLFKLLYSFHVVLFFIISGYTFSFENNKNFLLFIKKKFKSIMIPYFIWAFIYLVPYIILGSTVSDELNVQADFNLKILISNIFYGIGSNSSLKQNSSLWFLPALFMMKIIYYKLIKISDKSKNKTLIVLLVSIILMVLCSNFNFYLPWGINTALTLGVFYYIGWILKNKLDFLSFNNIYFFVFLLIGLISAFCNKTVSCIDFSYGNVFFMFFSGLFLSMCVLKLSKIINSNFCLEYIGKNTMGILIFHKLIILIFQTKLGYISKLILNSNFAIELLISLFATGISILFSLIISKMILYKASFLLGKNYTRKQGGIYGH